jgi:hypothetical protein
LFLRIGLQKQNITQPFARAFFLDFTSTLSCKYNLKKQNYQM